MAKMEKNHEICPKYITKRNYIFTGVYSQFFTTNILFQENI